jgi:hypothetical protein
MDIDYPERDQNWDDAARSETETERLDRNWSTLLQELRVTQTGVQLLTGFLLTLPFQQRFDALDDTMRGVYAATVACSVAATLALVAPVAMHLVLFRQHRLRVLVSAAHRLAYAGLVLLGLALVGVTFVVFDVVCGRGAAAVAGARRTGRLRCLVGDLAAVDAHVWRRHSDPFPLSMLHTCDLR